MVAKPHRPTSPMRAWACFLDYLASLRGNLPQAQHKLPGLSYLKGAFYLPSLWTLFTVFGFSFFFSLFFSVFS